MIGTPWRSAALFVIPLTLGARLPVPHWRAPTGRQRAPWGMQISFGGRCRPIMKASP